MEAQRLLKACTYMAQNTKSTKTHMATQLREPLRYYARAAQGLVDLFRRQDTLAKEFKLMLRQNPPPSATMVENRTKIFELRFDSITEECKKFEEHKLHDFRAITRSLATAVLTHKKHEEKQWLDVLAKLENNTPLEVFTIHSNVLNFLS